jgi:MoaA/NifB/PqqE/SkfB family radical SAM enzyme
METAYSLLIEKLSRQASNNKIPLNGAFELTSRCNFNCRMCYIHNQSNDCGAIGRELTTEQWIRLATEARDAGMLDLILTGGEIFLRRDFKEIYESVARMGFNISLYTNASLIDEKKAKWLGKIPPTAMEITLYGASAETYEKVCGNGNAYEKVVHAIDLLLAEGINIELKTTATEDNLNDYDAMAEFSFKRGIPLSIVDYLYPVRSSSQKTNACRLTPEKLVNFQEIVYHTNRRLFGIYSKGAAAPDSSNFTEKLAQDLDDIAPTPQRAESAFSCNAGSSDFWITWDGRMLPCGALEEPSFHPLVIGFNNAWNGLTEACDKIPVCQECKNCELLSHCDVCPAKLKSETGCYNQPAPYLCELARLSKERLSDIDDIIEK